MLISINHLRLIVLMWYNKHRIVIMQFEINVKILIKHTHTMKCLPSRKSKCLRSTEQMWLKYREVKIRGWQMSIFQFKCVLKNEVDLSESNTPSWIICHYFSSQLYYTHELKYLVNLSSTVVSRHNYRLDVQTHSIMLTLRGHDFCKILIINIIYYLMFTGPCIILIVE